MIYSIIIFHRRRQEEALGIKEDDETLYRFKEAVENRCKGI